MKKVTLIISLLFFVQACGWQLRGYDQYKSGKINSIERLHLQTSIDNRLFESSLKRLLRDMSIAIDATSDIQLVIKQESTERRPLSYSSTGIPVQYQLIMSVDFAYAKIKGTPLSPKRFIARRQYDFDTSEVVAKNEEEEKLLQEMREELAARIITTLQD